MKKYIVTISFLLFGNIVGYTQTRDETAIRNVMDAQLKAWNKGDIDAFMQTYWKSDSLLFVGSKGPTFGWQNTLDNYKKGYPDTAAMGKLDFTIVQVRPLSAGYSFVLGKWHLSRSTGDVGGTFTLIFRKINGYWLIVADHSS